MGLPLTDRETIRARLERTVGNPVAKSSIDMAVWDALGKTLDLPVTNLLGGYTDRMRVCHMLGFDEPAAMVAEAERMRTTYGIETFKVKVGRQPYSLDTAVVRALREGLGDGIELYVDGNRGWTASESARALDEMRDLGLTLAEELCPADDVLGRRWLVQRCGIPFVADESAVTTADVTREVLSGAATAISIKTARTGFTGSSRIHHLCEGLGVEVVTGNQIDGQLGSMCTVAFGSAYRLTSRRAGELSNFLDMSDDLLTEPLEIRNGELSRRGPARVWVSPSMNTSWFEQIAKQRALRFGEKAEEYVRVLAHDEMRHERQRLPRVGQPIERRHRRLELVTHAADVERQRRRSFRDQGAAEETDHLRQARPAACRAPRKVRSFA